MKKLIYAPQAIEDIDSIWDYTTNKWGVDQAKTYTKKIDTICQSIAEDGTRLKLFEDISDISGFIRCEHHYIFIIQNDEITYIIAVLHEKMDFFTHLAQRLKIK